MSNNQLTLQEVREKYRVKRGKDMLYFIVAKYGKVYVEQKHLLFALDYQSTRRKRARLRCITGFEGLELNILAEGDTDILFTTSKSFRALKLLRKTVGLRLRKKYTTRTTPRGRI